MAFRGAISHVVQAFRESGRHNPTKDADNMLSVLLSRQFRAYRNDDPKEVQQKALPFIVLEELAKRRVSELDRGRQMVERRLFAIYLQAGRTILERRCAKNANTSIIPNDPRHRTSSCVQRRSPAAQPSRQRRDEEKYWTRRVSTGATTGFLSFQLTNRRRRSN